MDGDSSNSKKNPLQVVEDFFEGFFFFWKESCLIKNREEIPMMMKSRVRWELKKFIEWYCKKFDFFTTITHNISNLRTISSYIVVYIRMNVAGAMKHSPYVHDLAIIPGLFSEFTMSTIERTLIRRIKWSSRKGYELGSPWLLLSSEQNTSVRKNRKYKCSIQKTNRLKSSHRTIIEFLIPLVYLGSHSWKYEFSIFGNNLRWRHRFIVQYYFPILI